MKRLLPLFLLSFACAHVEPYTGSSHEPVVNEIPWLTSPIDSRPPRVYKNVSVSNPFSVIIHVTLDCVFVHELEIPPHSTRFVMAETPTKEASRQTCRVTSWYML